MVQLKIASILPYAVKNGNGGVSVGGGGGGGGGGGPKRGRRSGGGGIHSLYLAAYIDVWPQRDKIRNAPLERSKKKEKGIATLI